MMGDKRFIRTLKLRNLLSFGPDSPPIEFGPLNVLIGPNGSGKSNIIEAIDLLRASATDLVAPLRAGGGTGEWLWKGYDSTPVAEVNATIRNPGTLLPYQGTEPIPYRHRISFSTAGLGFDLVDEAIEDEDRGLENSPDVDFYYRYQRGRPVLSVRALAEKRHAQSFERGIRFLRSEDYQPNQSILSQFIDPIQYPEITYLAVMYRNIKLYENWELGRRSKARLPQSTDLSNDFLAEDASNLGLILNNLERQGNIKEILNSHLRRFYDQYRDYSVAVEGGTMQVFWREKTLNHWLPASRLSDGTMRFLCLASVLCHPSPPSLICIEEPEIGLHPDILTTVAEMLVETSKRTQIIVTTHSDILVDALSHVPEAVLVCEKEHNATIVRRLDQHALQVWLKEYSLGDLWRRGQLGGNRW